MQTNKILVFLQKLKDSGNWNDDYDYSKVDYINVDLPVIIIDKNYKTSHLITPYRLLRGVRCSITNASDKTTYFLFKLKEIHNEKYDYSKVNYINNNTKIKIICPEHGEFEQLPSKHLTGHGCLICGFSKGVKNAKVTRKNKASEKIIKEFTNVHCNKYDYSLIEYTGGRNKVKIICPIHGEFEQTPQVHKRGQGCPVCSRETKITGINEFIFRSNKIHNEKYDYSNVNYINQNTNIIIICPEHGEFTQKPVRHLNGRGCRKCAKNHQYTNKEIINEFTKIHNNQYDYSKVEYKGANQKVKIICPIHGEFEQIPSAHKNGQGCSICSRGWENKHKLELINNLQGSDLLNMDPFEIYTIIGQGNLPVDFGTLANTDANSDERMASLQELRERFNTEADEDIENDINVVTANINDVELVQVDDIDNEITDINRESRLPSMNIGSELHSLDNQLYATMDEEAFESLIQYKLRKLWNSVLNNDISLETLQNDTGGKYFTMIRDLFLTEYAEANAITTKNGYSFKYKPNLMQKLTVLRLIKNKSYGNWSGTGAGKTLSFIVASREIESRLTVIIALNSTIKQTCNVIKEVYPDSITFTEYKEGQVFDRNKYNYLVLNYEKFQQEYSEEMLQSLTNNNQIDFVVIDEVHNAKQREEDNESIRRGVLNRFLGRIRLSNTDLHTLVMSATPVVNNLYEAKSLLTLMTGLEYSDLDTRRTLPNALKIFQQLVLNGLRYIPKYDIQMTELTGVNMSNLNIDGTHLLDSIIELPQSKYVELEKLLLEDKLNTIQPYLRKGVILFSYFTTGFINEIENYVRTLGYSVGTYTGDESIFAREDNLNKFISGDIDILIGSRPIGTGVDGLQGVCNRMILLTLPWTDSEYTQLKGRIYRQGSSFGDVEIIIPQVRINLEDGNFWSWDIQRLNVIKNKKTLADAAVDGVVPSRVLPTPNTMYKKSQESLQLWKDRINNGKLIETTRRNVQIDLYPEITNPEQRQYSIESELSNFNKRGKITKSSTMHKEFTENPESWFRYHALRNERMDQWEEIPYEYIAAKIKNKNHKVIDFGCGENKFKDCISNEVISFDHIAIDESVIACDMSDVSQWVLNESVDITVFSLALWGTNYKDYMKEAYRVLTYGGVIHIAEPSKNYDTPELEKELIELISEVGFKVVGNIEKRGKFIYITGIKM